MVPITIDLLDSRLDSVCKENRVVSYSIVKEAYTPYSLFRGLFLCPWQELPNVTRVRVKSGSKFLHEGIVDSIEFFRKCKTTYLSVVSKSLTSLMCQNQIAPGMKTGVTLSSLMRFFGIIPGISFESTPSINYVYIKDGSTMWDAAVNFSYRMNGTYPYVTAKNVVRTTPHEPTVHVNITGREAVKNGVIYDNTRLISDISMQDVDGNYDSFVQASTVAPDYGIIRKKQIGLDMQYLSDPEIALDIRLKYSQRGMKCSYIEYVGHRCEDLYDYMTASGFIEKKRIHKIILRGTSSVAKTWLGTYDDGFLVKT